MLPEKSRDDKKSLDESWASLIAYAQDHPYAKVIIQFKEGKPYEIIRSIETIRFKF